MVRAVLAWAWMVTVPAHSFWAPTLAKLIAARGSCPGSGGVGVEGACRNHPHAVVFPVGHVVDLGAMDRTSSEDHCLALISKFD